MGDRIALVLTVLAFLFLAGTAYVGSTMPERPSRTEYTLEASAESTETGVVVRGTTNLPDGARLDVVVDRLYRIDGKATWSAARVGEAVAVVSGGKWEATVPVEESEWVDELAGDLLARRVDPVAEVQPTLRTTVVFSPFTAQPLSIYEAVGPNFEGLADSDAALATGEFWLLRRRDEVERPLRIDLERKLLPAGA